MSKKDKIARYCARQMAAVKAADKAMWSKTILTKEREAARKKLESAQKRLAECKKQFSAASGILYAKGLARAAHDTKQRFALAPDFAKKAGIFKADAEVKKAFKVSKMDDAVLSGKKIAKKMGLEKAAQYAATSQALKDALTGTTAGFITAQVGATVVDIIGTVVSLGAYAVAAPAVHAALAGGQKVTTALLQKDIELNEQKYKGEIEKYFAKKQIALQKKEATTAEKDVKELEALEKQAAAVEKEPVPSATPSSDKPWYTSPVVLIGGGFLVGLTIYAATRSPSRD